MRRRRALVIEDEPNVQHMLEAILEPAGYAVTATDSALGALGLAKRLRPDAILLDLALPYRSGTALLDELKADVGTADVPVLVVSANTHLLSAERRALAADIIAKPFDAGDLLDAVGAACDPRPRPLRELRAERLLTIHDLARKAGVAPQTIFLVEAGRTTPAPSLIRPIVAVLGVEPAEVAEFRGPLPSHGGAVDAVDKPVVGAADAVLVSVSDIGRRIAHGRARLGLRQQELARRAGLSEAYINRLEHGVVRNPKVQDLARVAGALGVSLGALLCGDAPPGEGALAALVASEPQLAAAVGSLARGLRFAEPEDRAFILDHIGGLAARFGR